MSSYVKYDPDLLTVERATVVSSKLGEFILGVSQLGQTDAAAWAPVPSASVTITHGYSVSDNYDRTLLLDADQATMSLAFVGEPAEYPVYPGDRIRITYDSQQLILGTVVDTSVKYESVPDPATAHGNFQLVQFSASLSGTYTTVLSKSLQWMALPEEGALNRISRWVTVDNPEDSPDPDPVMPASGAGTATILDLIRLYSTYARVPVRLISPTTIQIVDTETLPTGFTQDDAEAMYYTTDRKVQAGLSELALESGTLTVSVGAALITDDVRVVVSDWQIPGPLPVYNLEPAKVKRVTYQFTPHSFTGDVEFHVAEAPLVVRRTI